ncbi:MAG: class I SAM-dependent methyltransferase, partial [Dehalococcoidia bacterium]
DLGPGRSYLDVGCGTARYAHLLAGRAGLDEPPVCLDLVDSGTPLDVVAWPERLPFADESFEVITSFYFIRRLDDDTVHGFGREIARLLAPGGVALLMDIAPVRSSWLNRLHERLIGLGSETVDLRGWGRLAALLTECGFDEIGLAGTGPFVLPPVPRLAVLLRRGRPVRGGDIHGSATA